MHNAAINNARFRALGSRAEGKILGDCSGTLISELRLRGLSAYHLVFFDLQCVLTYLVCFE